MPILGQEKDFQFKQISMLGCCRRKEKH